MDGQPTTLAAEDRSLRLDTHALRRKEREFLIDNVASHFVQSSSTSFFANYLPTLPGGYSSDGDNLETSRFLKQIKERLIQANLLHADNTWTTFGTAREAQLDENATYVKLGEIVDAIIAAATIYNDIIEPTCVIQKTTQAKGQQYKSDFRAFPTRERLRALCLEDEERVLSLGATEPPHLPRSEAPKRVDTEFPAGTTAIAAIVDIKLWDRRSKSQVTDPSNHAQDELNIIGAAKAIMYKDPRRKFLYGFTINVDDVCLWYFGRGHDPDSLIKFILALVFSTPEGLGFELRSLTYEYRVDGKRYLTTGSPIYDEGAYYICSRATRVWLVREIKTDGDQNYLSDDLVEERKRSRPHIRTVYAEMCESVYELKDFRSLVCTLIDIVEALRYLRKAGYVHRDISGGNCLWYRTGGMGKISDFEYAKPFAELRSTNIQTGTPSFMAVEAQQQRHLFIPDEKLMAAFLDRHPSLRRPGLYNTMLSFLSDSTSTMIWNLYSGSTPGSSTSIYQPLPINVNPRINA
ncbi:hypothetical protein H0H92_001310 [Tricholoma furcatifolium]|nr:hypothetical protein H0H92_001310 [Tricholoma furcatifolium]